MSCSSLVIVNRSVSCLGRVRRATNWTLPLSTFLVPGQLKRTWPPHSMVVSRAQSTRAFGPYTTAFALFEALWEAGVTRCFVNVGSDHPSILEAMVRGKRERPDAFPQMITCPSEITAISMADGYARVSGRPQAVLVHTDIGTQALAQGMHNASIGRAPVLIFAGLCPYTESGELLGSRTEYNHWLQDAPDQKALVRQYCRYTAEVRTGLNIKQMVGRALQFSNSTPKGPVYLACAREVLAQEIEPYSLDQTQWKAIGPSALPDDGVRDISNALVKAERPLIITGYSGRDRQTPDDLVKLADLIPGIRVHDTGGSDVCFPFSHPASQGFRLSTDGCTTDADAILIIDCDVPWIPSVNPPARDTKIYHIDSDPLNQQMPVSFFPAHGRWKTDSYTALTQLVHHISTDPTLTATLQDPIYTTRLKDRKHSHSSRLAEIASRTQPAQGSDSDPAATTPPQSLNVDAVSSLLKAHLPASTTYVVEAVMACQRLHDQLQPSRPGSWIGCGGTGIGWSNGAVLGVKMAVDDLGVGGRDEEEGGLVCQVVGDGSFMCAAPASALWVGGRYAVGVLRVVLNNGGWKAPRNSANIVYPDGLTASGASDEEINCSFRPSPNYAKLAEAAAGDGEGGDKRMKGVRVRTVDELKEALGCAKERLLAGEEGKGMLIEVMLPTDS